MTGLILDTAGQEEYETMCVSFFVLRFSCAFSVSGSVVILQAWRIPLIIWQAGALV
jgi:hypothetical protein